MADIIAIFCNFFKKLETEGIHHQSVQSLSCVPTLCDPMNHSTPGLPVHHQTRSSLRLTSIESVMPSSHLILCLPLLLLPPIPPSIKVFSNESALCMRWSKYWSFSFSIIPCILGMFYLNKRFCQYIQESKFKIHYIRPTHF